MDDNVPQTEKEGLQKEVERSICRSKKQKPDVAESKRGMHRSMRQRGGRTLQKIHEGATLKKRDRILTSHEASFARSASESFWAHA